MILRAAARTSINTKLPIQCHTFSANSAVHAVSIIEEENLPLNKFIWVHADGERNINIIKQLAQKGIWIEFDCLARTEDFNWYIQTIKLIVQEGMSGQLLISQDAGTFYYGQKNTESSIFPYNRLFKEFFPICKEQGIPQGLFDELLIKNPLRVLDSN
jgi:phosphotriesterase-related protein